MKAFINLLIATILLVVFLGLARSPLPMPPDNTTTLTDTTWVAYSGFSDSLFYDTISSTWITDLMLITASCDSDDVVTFFGNDTLTITEGPTECTDTVNLEAIYEWYFDANEDTIFLVTPHDDDTMFLKVLKITTDTLRMSYEYPRGSSIRTHTVTYIPTSN